MAVKRTFLGWHGSPLVRACDGLLQQGTDLSSVVVVTPGARLGRLLLGLLVDRAKGPLSPPIFVTPGEVADAVFGERGTPASPVQSLLAWERALTQCGPLPALLPRQGQNGSLRGAAGLLSRCHDELIGEAIRFSDVPERGGLTSPEFERWADAARVQAEYEAQLSAAGFIDAGLARLHSLSIGSPVKHAQIVLVCVPELSEVARRALLSPGVNLHVMIAAPEDQAAAFDELGTIRTEEWLQREVPLREDQIDFAQGPAEQAAAAFAAIAALNGRYSVHDVAIAIPDAALAPHLERAARRYGGVSARPASGTRLGHSSVAHMLESLRAFLEGHSFESFAALVRHPDMERFLLRKLALGGAAGGPGGREGGISRVARGEQWLGAMDEFARNALPASITGPFPGDITSRIIAEVRKLLAPLTVPHPDPNALLLVMQQIYLGNRASRNEPAGLELSRACTAFQKAISQVAALPPEWRPNTAAALIRVVIESCGSLPLPAEASADALELLGWLELPLDPTPVAVVTGVNDGCLPESFGADALLPDGLRDRLGIASSQRRQARDTYLMTLLLHSRDHVKLICGKSSSTGEPLLPSRILFAASPHTVVQRVRQWCSHEHRSPALRVLGRAEAPGDTNQFEAMPRFETDTVSSMRVTSFRTYLESPYRFYLEHVLGLKEVERPEPEMDPMCFGNLIHEVLERFGASDARDSADVRRIRECMMDHLAAHATALFGADPAMAVRVQLEVARARLEEVAHWQAERRAAGWLIKHVEWKPEGGVPLPGMGRDFRIRGKIDRVDQHEQTHQAAILDYKTGETVEPPSKTHGKPGGWKDLQLPLYRHLSAALKLPPDNLLLGYVAVPSQPGGVGVLPAPWTPEELADADSKAREIAARVMKGDFFDLGSKPPEEGTFAAIAGTAFNATRARGEDDE